METIFTIDIPNGPTATLIDYGPFHIFIMDGDEVGTRVEVMDGVPVDPPLSGMSSMPYIVINESTITYGNHHYKVPIPIPNKYKWTSVPLVEIESIIDYEANDHDHPFIEDGYAAEVKDAMYVVVPHDWSDIDPIDLLIRSVGTDGYESYSGRILSLDHVTDRVDGRYIYLNGEPHIMGPADVSIPYTYTIDSLHGRYELLQERLQEYGRVRNKAITASLISMADLIESKENQYRVSSIYDDVHHLIGQIKQM